MMWAPKVESAHFPIQSLSLTPSVSSFSLSTEPLPSPSSHLLPLSRRVAPPGGHLLPPPGAGSRATPNPRAATSSWVAAAPGPRPPPPPYPTRAAPAATFSPAATFFPLTDAGSPAATSCPLRWNICLNKTSLPLYDEVIIPCLDLGEVDAAIAIVADMEAGGIKVADQTLDKVLSARQSVDSPTDESFIMAESKLVTLIKPY
uniref:Pentatricopeptide repeat-containing protein n=1 Tax=Ananas comosus var. bracteatus TaxID=296719 RepID=A0A6V7QN51_ANACO|nr:unnamed protein product [Ananas comosus var. bracteatus]